MKLKEERKLTNIKLTESHEDNIWLHFESKGLKACVSLEALVCMQASGIVAATIQNWAREQLDKQKSVHRRFHLKPLPPTPSNEFLKEGQAERTARPVTGTRPTPPAEGGY